MDRFPRLSLRVGPEEGEISLSDDQRLDAFPSLDQLSSRIRAIEADGEVRDVITSTESGFSISFFVGEGIEFRDILIKIARAILLVSDFLLAGVRSSFLPPLPSSSESDLSSYVGSLKFHASLPLTAYPPPLPLWFLHDKAGTASSLRDVVRTDTSLGIGNSLYSFYPLSEEKGLLPSSTRGTPRQFLETAVLFLRRSADFSLRDFPPSLPPVRNATSSDDRDDGRLARIECDVRAFPFSVPAFCRMVSKWGMGFCVSLFPERHVVHYFGGDSEDYGGPRRYLLSLFFDAIAAEEKGLAWKRVASLPEGYTVVEDPCFPYWDGEGKRIETIFYPIQGVEGKVGVRDARGQLFLSVNSNPYLFDLDAQTVAENPDCPSGSQRRMEASLALRCVGRMVYCALGLGWDGDGDRDNSFHYSIPPFLPPSFYSLLLCATDVLANLKRDKKKRGTQREGEKKDNMKESLLFGGCEEEGRPCDCVVSSLFDEAELGDGEVKENLSLLAEEEVGGRAGRNALVENKRGDRKAWEAVAFGFVQEWNRAIEDEARERMGGGEWRTRESLFLIRAFGIRMEGRRKADDVEPTHPQSVRVVESDFRLRGRVGEEEEGPGGVIDARVEDQEGYLSFFGRRAQ